MKLTETLELLDEEPLARYRRRVEARGAMPLTGLFGRCGLLNDCEVGFFDQLIEVIPDRPVIALRVSGRTVVRHDLPRGGGTEVVAVRHELLLNRGQRRQSIYGEEVLARFGSHGRSPTGTPRQSTPCARLFPDLQAQKAEQAEVSPLKGQAGGEFAGRCPENRGFGKEPCATFSGPDIEDAETRSSLPESCRR